ncbi:FAD/NAD(P)-binding domain-containing protein [Phlegmacium glaucopus]|nr:FAD/NAD(P)-binding domain-containing protein [Phlegmacium glaucopus]
MSGQRAAVALKFIVVGGGISGIAAAYTLQKAGHHVLLLESSDGRSRSRGGMRAPPNMTNLLNQWGLGPILKTSTEECKRIDYYSSSGGLMGTMPMEDEFLEDLVADFRFIQHGHLQSLLFDLAKREGVTFQFNSRVIGADSASGYVQLQTGERLYADIIVGADGYDSILRPLVTEVEDFQDPDMHLILNLIIPADLLRSDKDLKVFTDPRVWTYWFGDGYVLHGNILNGRQDYSVYIHQNYKLPLQKGDDDWRGQCPLQRFGLDVNKFEPRTRKLLKMATSVFSRVFRARPLLDSFVCDHSRIVLVGEAAHPLLPLGHHSTSLAIEDAQTLGCLFSRLQHRDQLSRLLTAYDEIRHPRCASTQEYEYHHQIMLKAPLGPLQAFRDAAFERTLVRKDRQHMDEDTFRDAWGTELILFAHDATDKVKDWWGQWGYMIAKSRPEEVVSGIEVSISTGNTVSGRPS